MADTGRTLYGVENGATGGGILRRYAGMAKTADRAASDGFEPREVGRQLRHVRRKQGLSRSEVARSAGLTRRELAAYERGRAEVPESDLWCLAGSCGVDVSELLPNRAPVKVSSDLSLLAIGDSIRYLRDPVDDDEMLREYLSMIYELRNLPPGSRIPLRERDLMSLADALGGSPERIEARLIGLIGMSHQEAAQLRAMILPFPSLPAPAAATPQDPNNPYSQLTNDPAHAHQGEVVDFFSAQRSNDVFEPPPPPGPMPASSGWGDSFETPHYVPIDPIPAPNAMPVPNATPDPYEPPFTPSSEAFLDAAPPFAPVDPFAAPEAARTEYSSQGEYLHDAAAPMPPIGYLVDQPVAPTWPAHVPTAEASNLDIPTIDWGTDPLAAAAPAPTAEPGTAPFGTEPTHPSYAPAPHMEPAEQWGDADPLPRRLPLSGLPVAPQFEQWAEPLAPAPFLTPESSSPPAAVTEVFEVSMSVASSEPFAPAVPPQAHAAPPIYAEPQTYAPLEAVAPLAPAPVAPPPPAPAEAFVAPPVLAPPTAYTIPEPPAPLAPPLAAPPVAPIAWNAGTAADAQQVAAPAQGPTFDRAGSNWRVGGIFPATATADDGALALRRADARWALADVSAPSDFVLEAAVDFTAGAGFGVLFRATVDDHDRVNGYSFDIDPIAGGGRYLVRQWEDNRQHWRPLAQSTVTDPTLLFGRHALSLSLRADQLTVVVDGETVMSVPALSRCSIELGRQPCRGPHIGIQAWATTEVTVDSFRVARY